MATAADTSKIEQSSFQFSRHVGGVVVRYAHDSRVSEPFNVAESRSRRGGLRKEKVFSPSVARTLFASSEKAR